MSSETTIETGMRVRMMDGGLATLSVDGTTVTCVRDDRKPAGPFRDADVRFWLREKMWTAEPPSHAPERPVPRGGQTWRYDGTERYGGGYSDWNGVPKGYGVCVASTISDHKVGDKGRIWGFMDRPGDKWTLVSDVPEEKPAPRKTITRNLSTEEGRKFWGEPATTAKKAEPANRVCLDCGGCHQEVATRVVGRERIDLCNGCYLSRERRAQPGPCAPRDVPEKPATWAVGDSAIAATRGGWRRGWGR